MALEIACNHIAEQDLVWPEIQLKLFSHFVHLYTNLCTAKTIDFMQKETVVLRPFLGQTFYANRKNQCANETYTL